MVSTPADPQDLFPGPSWAMRLHSPASLRPMSARSSGTATECWGRDPTPKRHCRTPWSERGGGSTRFEASGALGGWLYRIATNVCLDELRSKRARIDPVSLGPPSPSGTAPTAPDPELTWVEPVADASLLSSGRSSERGPSTRGHQPRIRRRAPTVGATSASLPASARRPRIQPSRGRRGSRYEQCQREQPPLPSSPGNTSAG